MLQISCLNERGSTTTEHAIALPIYFFLILVSIEILRISYYHLSVHFVASSIMREVSINNSLDVQLETKNRLQALGITFNNTTDKVTYCPRRLFPATAPCATNAIVSGIPLEPMALKIDKKVGSFLPLSSQYLSNLNVSSLVIGRNEPK